MEGSDSRKRPNESPDYLPALLAKGGLSTSELWTLFEGYTVLNVTVQPATVQLPLTRLHTNSLSFLLEWVLVC